MAKGFQNSVKAQEKQKLSQLNSQFLEESFFHNFSALNDPRIERSKEHLLIDIVAISILAVISGAEGVIVHFPLQKSQQNLGHSILFENATL